MKRACVALALVACHTHDAAPALDAAPPPASVATVSAPREAGVDPRLVTVEAWNDAHAKRDAAALAAVYADEVDFYRTKLPRAKVVAGLKGFFVMHRDFTQSIRDVSVTDDAGATRVTFVKTVTEKGKSTDYPSYLELTRTADGWRVATEGDALTDKNLDAKKCTPLAWSGEYPRGVDAAELAGKLEAADGFDANQNVEHYFRLVLDKPACLPAGGEATETPTAHAYAEDDELDLSKWTGKHVRVKGTAFEQHTAHHHEPIVIAVDSITTP